jgi:hypothetical protein
VVTRSPPSTGGSVERGDLRRKAGYHIAESDSNCFIEGRKKVPEFPSDEIVEGEDR